MSALLVDRAVALQALGMTGAEFGSRAGLYERLYFGDPEINAQRRFKRAIAKDESLVRELLRP
jgi:hypothetical protein